MSCPECNQPQVWAGMSWHPHSEQQHAGMRARLVQYAARLLVERTAALTGHHVTIRFTATEAWFECACGETGARRDHSGTARLDGHDHLYESAPYCTGDRCGDCEAPTEQNPDDECCEGSCGCCPRAEEHGNCFLYPGSEDDSKYCDQHGEHWLNPRSPEAQRRYQIPRGGA